MTCASAKPGDPARVRLRAVTRWGWALFALWAVVLSVWALVQPDPYAQGWRLVLELAFLGRLVSIVDGVATGFGKTYLLFQCGLQDIILLLLLYAPVVGAYEGAVRRGLVARQIDQVRRAAERHKSRVEPFGAIGLWAFVFFPFWSTGALVGGVVGYLLGMRTRVVFASVFTGHVLSTVALIYFFDYVEDIARSFNEGIVRFLPWIVLGLLLVIALVARVWWRGREEEPGDRPERGENA